jgi:hypothetical protein
MDETDLIRGVWTWGRGGGWQGPYISGGGNGLGGALGGGAAGEFWEDINAYVVSQWAAAQLPAVGFTAAKLSEEELFRRYCADVLGLNGELQQHVRPVLRVYFATDSKLTSLRALGTQPCNTLRNIALQSADAVLKMHYCHAYDSRLQPNAGGAILLLCLCQLAGITS